MAALSAAVIPRPPYTVIAPLSDACVQRHRFCWQFRRGSLKPLLKGSVVFVALHCVQIIAKAHYNDFMRIDAQSGWPSIRLNVIRWVCHDFLCRSFSKFQRV
jgi:hypothetical protein